MPAKMNHYAYTKKATTILLHGMGPVEFIYVNPADDPRNAGQALTAHARSTSALHGTGTCDRSSPPRRTSR